MSSQSAFSKLSLEELLAGGQFDCACGKTHRVDLKRVEIGEGAIQRLPDVLMSVGIRHPFLIADQQTFAAAGSGVQAVLAARQIPQTAYCFPCDRPEPDESAVGLAAMRFDDASDGVIAVGSGSIGDISKVIARVSGLPLVTVATAPSMDGFASPTCSMVYDGIKSTVPGVCPAAIVADLDILSAAPMRMLQAGLGDMAAKPVALTEWQIAHCVTGEPYCAETVNLMRASAEKCLSTAEGLIHRDPLAVRHITEGLILSGIAMSFAGVTRPASGIEHYFSHIWDMRALHAGRLPDLHGIQVGIGTLQALRVYQRIMQLTPDPDKATHFVRSFDAHAWAENLRRFLPQSAEEIIRNAAEEKRVDPALHTQRLARILAHWEEIRQCIRQGLASEDFVRKLLRNAGAPTEPSDIGIDAETLRQTFLTTKDLRSKYMATNLLWDLGELDDFAAQLS